MMRFIPRLQVLLVPIVGLCTLWALVAAVGVCRNFSETSHTAATRNEVEVPLEEILEELGRKVDCYFTVEQSQLRGNEGFQMAGPLHDDDHRPQAFRKYHKPDHLASVEEIVAWAGRELPAAHVRCDVGQPKVIRLIDKDLDAMRVYVMNETGTIPHEGDLRGLLSKVIAEFPRFQCSPTDMYSQFGLEPPLWSVPVAVANKRSVLRQILTESLPLSQCARVLWQSNTYWSKEELVPIRKEDKIVGFSSSTSPAAFPRTELDFSRAGPLCELPRIPREVEDQILRLNYPSRATISFEEGELACARNPDTFGPNPEDNTAQMAIKFIQDRMAARNPLQVRWAMFFLGKVKADEGIPVLLEYLDYQYTTHGIVEESYPALKALRQIGKPAATAAIAELAKEQSELRTELLCRVVLAVHGHEKGKVTLEEVIKRTDPGPRKNRLQKALAKCVEEAK